MTSIFGHTFFARKLYFSVPTRAQISRSPTFRGKAAIYLPVLSPGLSSPRNIPRYYDSQPQQRIIPVGMQGNKATFVLGRISRAAISTDDQEGPAIKPAECLPFQRPRVSRPLPRPRCSDGCFYLQMRRRGTSTVLRGYEKSLVPLGYIPVNQEPPSGP